MSDAFERLTQLNRIVHEPARLAILTALTQVNIVDFTFLQRLTGLTRGNLSSHLATLEAAGLILITKEFVGKTPHTSITLTEIGREAVEQHWQQLERLRADTHAWRPEDK